MDKKKKLLIYLGCALTLAPKSFTDEIINLKQILKKKYAILEFLGVVKGTPKDVFIRDTKCVKDCDLFVAECSYPAIGLGYEIGMAIYEKKPILTLANINTHVTRMVQGISVPRYKFVRYNNISEVPLIIDNFIKEFQLI
ncbi:MAG TPA: hypothetical protein VJC17_04260 [Candidatus Dojkabacteria bacterium]|nr:hypothetical protein [Candidatus Dojkabacteria bacterium]